MSPESFLPPGQHPLDQASGTKAPVDYQLERLCTYLRWNLEHFASFQHDRESDPENAERELAYLEDTIERGYEHLRRLTELLRAGYQPTLEGQ